MTEKNILDSSDLEIAYRKLRADFLTRRGHSILELYGSPKPSMKLRFHQELFISETMDYIQQGMTNFLWGAKCRSGKTYMAGGLVLKLFDVRKKVNVLIITPAPTETMPQFSNDLFRKFSNFDLFGIHDIHSSSELRTISLKENNVLIISKQLLQAYTGESTIQPIKDLMLDAIIFDENHFSGTTDIARDIILSYSSKTTCRIFMTATYYKPLAVFKEIPELKIDNVLTWDLMDEQSCKDIHNFVGDKYEQAFGRLFERHRNCVDVVNRMIECQGLSLFEVFRPYLQMPTFSMITNQFEAERYQAIKSKIGDTSYGFSFDALFSLNQKKKFVYLNEVQSILRYISGSNRMEDYPKGDRSIFSRIESINGRRPFVQLWFLPEVGIADVSNNLKEQMANDRILRNYDVLCINSQNQDLSDVGNDICRAEMIAKSRNKLGLILLTGKMLTLGITIPSCDVVFLMHNSKSSDKVIQQIFRSMTEGNDKQHGIVVDFDIGRVVENTANLVKVPGGTRACLEYAIQYNLINIDEDMFTCFNTDIQGILSRLMEMWGQDRGKFIENVISLIQSIQIQFNSEMQKQINTIFNSHVKGNTATISVELVESPQELPRGSPQKTPPKQQAPPEIQKVKVIDFVKDILPYVLPLTCFLTIEDDNVNFVKMLYSISETPVLLEAFEEQCQIWWNDGAAKFGTRYFIDFIRTLAEETALNNNPDIENRAIDIKLGFRSLIDTPDCLLKAINNSLMKTNDKERQENGEVFTPMDVVNDILNHLDVHFTKLNGHSIFEEEKLTWFDPATGMGNFPVAVYLRLFEGLRNKIPDDLQRKRHILEKMLYMSELNTKNVYLCKQIFDLDRRFNLNLHRGNTLSLDTVKEWGIDKFDVVMGNPPYNSGGIKSSTGKKLGESNKTVWPAFVEYALSHLREGGFLCYITPLSWLSKTHDQHNLLTKHVVWLKLWNNARSKQEIGATIPISQYVIQNISNDNHISTIVTSESTRGHINQTSEVWLDSKVSTPLAYHSIFSKIRDFIVKYNASIPIKSSVVKGDGDKISLPNIYTANDMLGVDTYTLKDGIMVKRMTHEHPDLFTKKLIIANKCSFEGVFIDDGRLGLVGTDKFYILGDRLELLLKMFSFKLIKMVGHFVKYRQDFLDRQCFDYIPDIRVFDIQDITEDQLYELIGLTPEEIKSVNTFNQQ